MTIIFFKVLSIFSLLGLGVILNKTEVLPIVSVKYLSAFILAVTTPCLNFSSMLALPFDKSLIRPIIENSIGINIFYFTAFFVAVLIIKGLKNVNRENFGILIVTMITLNSGFLGFPVTQSVFGDSYLFFMVIQNAASSIMFFVMIPYFLDYGSESKNTKSPLEYAKSIIKNPPIIGCVLGLIFFINSLSVPEMAKSVIDMVGNITPPLSMIVIGVQLGEVKIKELISDIGLNVACFAKLVIMPLMVFIVTFLLPLSVYTKIILTLSACFPTAAISSAFASTMNKNEKMMASAVALTTLFSVITIPIWCIILSYVYL